MEILAVFQLPVLKPHKKFLQRMQMKIPDFLSMIRCTIVLVLRENGLNVFCSSLFSEHIW
jgi:hypothetical protein